MITAESSIEAAEPESLQGLGVLQVLPRLSVGGAERSAVDIAIAIARRGGRSFVASAGGVMQRELERNGVRHLALPLQSKNPLTIRSNSRRLAAAIREHRIDIVHARSRAPAWSARAAALLTNVKFITTVHGLYGETGWFKSRYNRVMAAGARVIANSQFIAEHLRQKYQLDESVLVTIPRGIDLTFFDPKKVRGERMAELARKWRLPDEAHVVLMPARLTRRKGHHVLIEAMARVKDQELVAVVVGPAEGHEKYRGELLGLIARHGLHKQFRFDEHCADMPAAYMLADVVLSVSTAPEAFGRVIVEAQAMGKPVIASDHGGARETLLAGETGWLVKPSSSEDLAAAIRAAASMDTDTRLAVALAARSQVEQRFSVETMCARTCALYAELAAER